MKRGHIDRPTPAATTEPRRLSRPERTSSIRESQPQIDTEPQSPDNLLHRARYLGHRILPLTDKAAPRLVQPRQDSGQLIQRMAVQVEAGEDNKIQALRIVGRPPRTFASSMGDHTTAFAVHRISLEMQIVGKSFAEALQLLNDLYQEALKLPGYELSEKLPEEDRVGSSRASHSARLSAAESKLKLLLEIKPEIADSPAEVSELQEAVVAYLDFRELIPLSTINVRAKDPAQAGKGKGEAEKVEVLRDHQAGNPRTVPERLAAIRGLFDLNSSALAAVEQDLNLLAKMAPGLNSIKEILVRTEPMIKQHVQSIKLAFPGVFDIELTPEMATDDLDSELKPLLLAWLEASMVDLNKKIATDEAEIFRIRSPRMIKKDRDRQQILIDRRSTHDAAKMEIVEAINKLEPPKPKNAMEVEEPARIAVPVRDAVPVRIEAPSEDLESTAEVLPPAKRQKSEVEDEEDEASDLNEEEEARKSPLAMQILLDDQHRIAAVASEGRSPSPFPGTMGAHTTSWIVHIDRVRMAIVGSTVDQASRIVSETLVEEAKSLNARRQEIFKPKPGDELDKEHRKKLEEAERQLDGFPAKLTRATPAQRLLVLQSYLVQLLTFINYIPGSTINASDTGGKAEGSLRNVLMTFEKGEKQSQGQLALAIKRLLDLSEVVDHDQEELLKKNHMAIIKETYPKSYAKAFGPREPVEKVAKKKSKLKRRLDSDEEG